MDTFVRPFRKNNVEIVLAVLMQSAVPLTAYQILERVKPLGLSAPVTIYRALDALQDRGRVRRLESISAYMPIQEANADDTATACLICQDCGTVSTLHNASINTWVQNLANQTNFTISHPNLEVLGTCGHCKAQHGPYSQI